MKLLIAIILIQASLLAQVEYVRTADGFVRGQTNGMVDKFLGVPYAQPPVGVLRWKAPVETVTWSGVRAAMKPGGVCVQRKPGAKAMAGQEDCLYLNVYRPSRRDSGLLPVLVYIHGGSNQYGAGSDYDPSAMVAAGIIVVTINYRLGAFGFLALPSFDTETGEPSSGNFGFMDQQAALRWVHENIRGFGGNPDQVTLGGESAGGIDICAHLTSRGVEGLFEQVFLWSSYCPSVSHDEAIQRSAPVATALGCADAICLRTKSAGDVFDAASKSKFKASPNFGNSLLPVQPSIALSSGHWNRVPLLLGSNHDEAGLPLAAELLFAREHLPLTAEEYSAIVEKQFRSLAPEVTDEYPLAQFSAPFIALADEETDRSPTGCAMTPTADLFTASRGMFRFEFDDQSAPPPKTLSLVRFSLGAYHAAGVQYILKSTDYPGPQTQAQRELSDHMIDYWSNFVKTGDPNGPGLPRWPRYEVGSHKLLSLRPDASTVIDNFDTDHRCEFWSAARDE